MIEDRFELVIPQINDDASIHAQGRTYPPAVDVGPNMNRSSVP
jgi:hypothetical protein